MPKRPKADQIEAIETSQKALRSAIAEAKRLSGEAQQMVDEAKAAKPPNPAR